MPMPAPVVGRLVSVNTGLPKDVPWHGRTVHTGVWKAPVQGPSMVRTLNVDGDGQGDLAGHGGPHRAVLVYQLESYRHWARELNRADLLPGHFGENFTVDGLPDDGVRIGDQFQIGHAVFEISQPRVTCYRVGLRLEEPRLPALLVSHHRPGFYFRVLREGLVQAGDPIVKVGSGPEPLTVADVDALLYLPGHDPALVARALRMPALSPGWTASFRALLDAPPGAGNPGLSTPEQAPPAWSGLRPLRVLTVVRESGAVISLRLGALDGTPLPAARAGQFITLRVTPERGKPAQSRSYSLSGAPGEPQYRVSIKREPGGTVSEYIHARVRPGDLLDVAAPRGRFQLGDVQAPVLLLSAGIGATPVLAMLHSLAAASTSRPVWWLHGARNSQEHPFAAEVQRLLAQLANSRSEVAYSRPLPDDQPRRDYTYRGHLTGQFLAGLALPARAHAYVCGPGEFMTGIRNALTGLGVAPDQVHEEVFGPGTSLTPGIAAGPGRSPHPPPPSVSGASFAGAGVSGAGVSGAGVSGAGVSGAGPVTFARSGLTVPWPGGTTSLLELAEACDVPVRWSCRTGVCHNCETGLLNGSVRYDPLPIDLPAPDNVLICCAVPAGDVVLDL